MATIKAQAQARISVTLIHPRSTVELKEAQKAIVVLKVVFGGALRSIASLMVVLEGAIQSTVLLVVVLLEGASQSTVLLVVVLEGAIQSIVLLVVVLEGALQSIVLLKVVFGGAVQSTVSLGVVFGGASQSIASLVVALEEALRSIASLIVVLEEALRSIVSLGVVFGGASQSIVSLGVVVEEALQSTVSLKVVAKKALKKALEEEAVKKALKVVIVELEFDGADLLTDAALMVEKLQTAQDADSDGIDATSAIEETEVRQILGVKTVAIFLAVIDVGELEAVIEADLKEIDAISAVEKVFIAIEFVEDVETEAKKLKVVFEAKLNGIDAIDAVDKFFVEIEVVEGVETEAAKLKVVIEAKLNGIDAISAVKEVFVEIEAVEDVETEAKKLKFVIEADSQKIDELEKKEVESDEKQAVELSKQGVASNFERPNLCPSGISAKPFVLDLYGGGDARNRPHANRREDQPRMPRLDERLRGLAGTFGVKRHADPKPPGPAPAPKKVMAIIPAKLEKILKPTPLLLVPSSVNASRNGDLKADSTPGPSNQTVTEPFVDSDIENVPDSSADRLYFADVLPTKAETHLANGIQTYLDRKLISDLKQKDPMNGDFITFGILDYIEKSEKSIALLSPAYFDQKVRQEFGDDPKFYLIVRPPTNCEFLVVPMCHKNHFVAVILSYKSGDSQVTVYYCDSLNGPTDHLEDILTPIYRLFEQIAGISNDVPFSFRNISKESALQNDCFNCAAYVLHNVIEFFECLEQGAQDRILRQHCLYGRELRENLKKILTELFDEKKRLIDAKDKAREDFFEAIDEAEKQIAYETFEDSDESESESESDREDENKTEINHRVANQDETDFAEELEKLKIDDTKFNLRTKKGRNDATELLERRGKVLREKLEKEIGIPKIENTRILTPGDYVLACDSTTGNVRFSMERLTKEGVKNVGLKRSGTFRVDKYNHRDVEGYEERFSSYPELYERGHMANLANHPGSKVQMWSTFVYSNSTPMLPRFNRGLNNVLESFGRQLTHIGPVYVLTGGLDPSKQDNGIDIYGRFYKVFLVQTGDNVYDSYSWILPHENDIKLKELHNHVCMIEDVEAALNGVKLFEELFKSGATVHQKTSEDVRMGLFYQMSISRFIGRMMEKSDNVDPMLLYRLQAPFFCCVCGSETCKRSSGSWSWTKEAIPRRLCGNDYRLSRSHNTGLNERGVKELQEIRNGMKDRSHPDVCCCVCKIAESGRGKYWYWTNEETARRICVYHWKIGYYYEVKLDEAGVEEIRKARPNQPVKRKYDRESQICCVCDRTRTEIGKNDFAWTKEDIKRPICETDVKLAKREDIKTNTKANIERLRDIRSEKPLTKHTEVV